ncbi:MAG TPA: hypothetical protein DDX39_11130 [Bacteroidales bacterium]|nr:hypothetical protein [Bacteroidales bacterium]
MEAMLKSLFRLKSTCQMYKVGSLFFLFYFLFNFASISQNVSLYGYAPSYKGEEIVFSTFSDLITNTVENIGSCRVDSVGNFSCVLNLNETKEVFTDLGIFHCIFYAEPNQRIKINFPEKVEKELKDFLNPYFEPVQFFIGLNDSLDINFNIKTFDEVYDNYMSTKFLNMYSKPGKADVEFFIHRTEGRFIDSLNQYFNVYKKYKYASLKNLSYIMDYQRMTFDYFRNNPICYYNIAYMELFNSLFENFLARHASTAKGEELKDDIFLGRGISAIKNTLRKNIEFSNDTLQELILLKGLHDAFFIRNMVQYPTFPENQLHQVLDSIEILTKIPAHKKIAKNIRAKTKFLASGTEAPDFELLNNENEKISLKSLHGKYVYLNFCNTNSRECREEFELIKQLSKRYKNLEIISISTNSNFNEAVDYFNTNNYKWTLLDFNSEIEVVKKYNVNVFPTYFLIDKIGLFVLSPAKSPKENIDQLFKRIFKENEALSPNDYDDLFKKPSPLK